MPDKISLACTGNYRAMAESLVLWAQTRKKAYLIRSGVYLLILGLFFCRCMFQCAGPVWNGALYDLDPMRDFAVCVGMDEFLEGEI